ncbi:conserved hypothetical protein [Ricinus communis]|uniref:Uncharacterized protein n=1 Tax=Ricinus communis TaxID=3988 RepID=B9SLS4_RICCO|nr:conserved hypothetical protein [Ricinus communis]
MKLSGIAWITIVMIFLGTNTIEASTRNSFLLKPHELEQPPQFLTITGCNNDCDTACCNCDIQKQPPLCVQCCKEDP